MKILTFPFLRDRAQRATGASQVKRNALNRSRLAMLAAGALAAAAFSLPNGSAGATELPGRDSQNWVGTWSTAPDGPSPDTQLQRFTGQTLRLIVHTSIGGTQVRIGLSSEHGGTPLQIGAAHVALRQAGAGIVAATDRSLSFGGFPSFTIVPGTLVLSEPVALDVPAMSDLAVSIHLPGSVAARTIHGAALQTNYVSEPGDFTGAVSLPIERTMSSWPFLTVVDVRASDLGASIVALGDSITDGFITAIDANQRWPDRLARRLHSARESPKPFGGEPLQPHPDLHSSNNLGVLNKDIAGDRLRDPAVQALFGRSALARFERDVLTMAGVDYLIVLIGINDIGNPRDGAIPTTEVVAPEVLIAGYRQLIARAHERDISVFGATLTPFENTVYANYYTPEKELVRQAVNQWIRSSDEFDGVIDFERALGDPSHPARMLPDFDSGDHLHPNERGMQAMADAIPLSLFREDRFARRALLQR